MRIALIDNLRGFAFLFMIIQHIFYFYDVSTNYRTSYYNNYYIKSSGSIARYLFIFLVGYSLSLSYKNNYKFYKNRIKKSLLILFHALIISLLTWMLYPEKFIRFGILHFIGVATLLALLIVPYKKLYIIFFFISLYISTQSLYVTNNTIIDTMIGSRIYYQMIDYFPLVQWIPTLILGMFIESIKINNKHILNLIVDNSFLEFFNKDNNIITKNLSYLGQNCLNLYTIHLIILFLFYYFLQNYYKK